MILSGGEKSGAGLFNNIKGRKGKLLKCCLLFQKHPPIYSIVLYPLYESAKHIPLRPFSASSLNMHFNNPLCFILLNLTTTPLYAFPLPLSNDLTPRNPDSTLFVPELGGEIGDYSDNWAILSDSDDESDREGEDYDSDRDWEWP